MPYDTREHEKLLLDLLIQAGDKGMSSSELAEQIGVTTQTIRNYLVRLENLGEKINLDEGRYSIDPLRSRQPLRLTLAQTWMLYLPLRRMLRANLNRYRVVYDLLHHLAARLYPDLADAIAPLQPGDEQDIDRIIPRLVEAWKDERFVELRYQSLDKSYPTTFQVAPLWFEPAVWSDSYYLIGGFPQRDGSFHIQPLKFDRILGVTIRNERFARPLTSDLLASIEKSWGIWGGSGARVVLRFHYRVRTRLLETHWHPTQQIQTDEQGYTIWQSLIAEPDEMLPWIRGWGADVEVLEPAELREKVAVEAERTARLYGRGGAEDNSFF